MQQSKLGSLYESAINILIEFVVALSSQLVIFPMFDIDISISSNLGITLWFTLISVVRSYVVRRWFNARLRSAAMKMAGV
jgi:hypothetical protein